MDRSSHISGVATFDRIVWDEPATIACAHLTRGGGGVVLQGRSPQSRSASMTESEDLVILVMRDAVHRYDEASIGGLPVDQGFARGRFALIPPGRASRWVSAGHPAVLHIHFSPEQLAQLDHLVAIPFTYGIRANAHDPTIDRVGLQLSSELAAPGPLTALTVDTLLLGLALHLARHYSGRKGAHQGEAGRLARWRVARVLDLIEDRSQDTVSLDQLASEAGLSTGHFARCFKATFGLSVHRYVLERRMDRAKRMLEDTALPIAEVALACGFASQSHLTDCFRARARTTPGAWRRDAARGAVSGPPGTAARTLQNASRHKDSQRR